MARFVNAQVPEVVQPFWAALQAGEFVADAAVQAGTYRKQGTRWVAACGGVRPRRGRGLKGRCLSFSEREEIALARARGETIRSIARRLGRSPSTISRELKRNADRRDGRYRATTAHALAFERASRPKPAKLATNLRLRQVVQDDLRRRFSPEQIAGRLRRRFPDDPEMWVSTETIYQSLYVQSRGELRRELTRYLRTGRSLRKPGRQAGQRKNRIPDMVNIAQRPPEADERRVPGHWEGDLLIGKRNATAIATLVERASGFAMLVPLRDGYKPEHVAPALARKVPRCPTRCAVRSPGTKARRCATGSRSTSTPASRCTSATRTPPGSAAPTRTPTGYSASTFPRAPTSPRSPRPSSTPSPTSSTSAPASGLPSPTPPSSSPSCYCNDRQTPPIRISA
jgi:transposase, IS30 family